jgi:leucyl aminopeptidase (aminopeptidase T)
MQHMARILKKLPSYDALATAGAQALLTNCLSLRSGDMLAIFYDGTARRVAKHLRAAGGALGLRITERYISVETQIAQGANLGREDRIALSEAAAVVTCLSANPKSIKYRHALIETGTDFNTHFGHMPGAKVDLLVQVSSFDFEAAKSKCDDLTLALALSRRAELTTYDFAPNGSVRRSYDLQIELSPNRLPITSTGIIPRGTWGNIPGGEVFVAPAEDKCEGTFCLNGSMKGCVMPAGHSLLLEFAGGYMKKHSGPPNLMKRFSDLLSVAKSESEIYFNSVAELGIGVNSAITELTGVSLFDEKCAGTAHIAIGDNSRYGGEHECYSHEDLITRLPSLRFDGRPILNQGLYCLEPADWRDNISLQSVDHPVRQLNDMVRPLRANIQLEGSPPRKILRNQTVAAGRVCRYTIGDSETSAVLAQVFLMLPRSIGAIIQRCAKQLNLPKYVAMNAIGTLVRHSAASIHPNA